ncbi:MAG: aminotransferase class I/II-fold pyridoxal phosphate-dependent enzyme, partial [Actinomycetota bacterium]
ALAGRGDVVFSDELNHASIIDGCRLSRAERFVYRHCDLDHLAWGLRKAANRAALIATDGVFSMDGDLAPLGELVELARRHRCRLLVDEAHGTGALGPEGRGAIAEDGLAGEVDVIVGTLGKALGSYGAYVCASPQIVDLLVNAARPFIFSTGPPPPSVGAALAALELLESSSDLVDRLRRNADVMRSELRHRGLDRPGSSTQILPIVVGEADTAMALCERALERGVFFQVIRPPTLPEGTSRLRLTVMATHEAADLRRAAQVLADVAAELGLGASGAQALDEAA